MAVSTYVYRSRAADIVDEWEAFQAEHARWRRKVRRLVGHWFPRQGRHPVLMHSGFGLSERWVGVSSRMGDYNAVPDGWRYDRKHGHLLPLKKTKEGRELAKVFDANQPPTTLRQRLRGMPSHLWSGRHGLHTYSPGIERIGDAIYVTWSVELLASEDKYDPKVWERVRLSEYHRLREAAEADAA